MHEMHECADAHQIRVNHPVTQQRGNAATQGLTVPK